MYIFFIALCSSTQDLKAIRVHSGEGQILQWPKGIDEPMVKRSLIGAIQCSEQIVAIVR